jgi:hypothetical protein
MTEDATLVTTGGKRIKGYVRFDVDKESRDWGGYFVTESRPADWGEGDVTIELKGGGSGRAVLTRVEPNARNEMVAHFSGNGAPPNDQEEK